LEKSLEDRFKATGIIFVQKSELQQGNYQNPDTNLTLRQKRLKSQNVLKRSSICDLSRMPTLSWHVKKQKKRNCFSSMEA